MKPAVAPNEGVDIETADTSALSSFIFSASAIETPAESEIALVNSSPPIGTVRGISKRPSL